MGYNPNIPGPNDLLSDSQGQIRTNFTAANSVYGGDHYAYNDVTANATKHKKTTFPPQASSPSTIAGELALFSKTLGSGVALFLTRDNNTVFDVQLTTSSIAAPLSSQKGYTFLPGGMLLQWGRVAAPGTSGSETFGVAFSATPYTVVMTLERASGNQTVTIDTGTVTSTGFDYLSSSAGSTAIHWIAIGPKP